MARLGIAFALWHFLAFRLCQRKYVQIPAVNSHEFRRVITYGPSNRDDLPTTANSGGLIKTEGDSTVLLSALVYLNSEWTSEVHTKEEVQQQQHKNEVASLKFRLENVLKLTWLCIALNSNTHRRGNSRNVAVVWPQSIVYKAHCCLFSFKRFENLPTLLMEWSAVKL